MEFDALEQTQQSLDIGGSVKVYCSSDQEIRGCGFRSPVGEQYIMSDGDQYENGRIINYELSMHKCGLEIKTLEDDDNGIWECTITSRNMETKQSVSDTHQFTLEVAVPPASVMLREGSNQVTQLDVTKESEASEADARMIQCVALAARPEPKFKWIIGNEEMTAQTTESKDNLDDISGKADYVSTFTYYPDKNHNQKDLICKVEHSAYTQAQVAEEQNIARLKLNVNYAPLPLNKPHVEHSLEIGKTANVIVKIEANPKPDSASWTLGGENGTQLPSGQTSEDGKFQSGVIEEGDTDGQWRMTLTINNLEKEDTQVPYKLVVANSKGSNEYEVRLSAEPAPGPGHPDVTPVAEANFPVVIIILVIVIILAVVLVAIARVKGMLCFAAKNSDDSDPEKEAFDKDAEKGETAPIVDAKAPSSDVKIDANSSPEKKAPVVAEADETQKDTKDEDKKSNGTTPV